VFRGPGSGFRVQGKPAPQPAHARSVPINTLHPGTLHPLPCTLHPIPYTLHPAPYTVHHTPYTPHPTPYTPHLTSSNPGSQTLNLTQVCVVSFIIICLVSLGPMTPVLGLISFGLPELRLARAQSTYIYMIHIHTYISIHAYI